MGKNRKNACSRNEVKAMIKGTLNATLEHKYATNGSPTGTNWTTGGSLTALNTVIGQGLTIGTRSGDQIIVKKLTLRLDMVNATAASAMSARFIIFVDSMASGALPTVTDLLDTAQFLSPYNLVNEQRKRFKILYDQQHTLVFASSTQQKTVKIVLPLNRKVFYNDGSTANTAIGKGHMFTLMISDRVGGGGFSYLHETVYTDA